jgi:hypothetical protein
MTLGGSATSSVPAQPMPAASLNSPSNFFAAAPLAMHHGQKCD